MRGYISWIAGLRSPPFDDAVEGMDNPMADPFSVVTRDGQLVAAVSFRSQPVPGTVIVRRVMYDPDCDIGELVGAMVPLLAQSLRDFWADNAAHMPWLPPMPSQIAWVLASSSVIGRHLEARGLAVPETPGSRAAVRDVWCVGDSGLR